MKIISDKKNVLLKRREVVCEMECASNPGFAQSTKEIAKETGVSEEVVAIKKIDSSYGTSKFVVSAFLYDSVDEKNKIEPKPKQKKEAAK